MNLYESAKYGDCARLEELIRDEVDINLKDEHDFVALFYAVMGGHEEYIKKLILPNALGAIADVNITNNCGRTALHLCVLARNIKCASILLKKGALINARDDRNETPLHWAATVGNKKFIKFLLENGADKGAKDKDGFTPSDVCDDFKLREYIEKYRK